LTYTITPPAAAWERVGFRGASSINGKAYPVVGDQLMDRVNNLHPADQNPSDNAISMFELTAYAAAWKQGEAWPVAPSPIPLDFLTSAATLWKAGESYVFDPTLGPAPLCWVPGGGHSGPLSIGEHDGGAGRVNALRVNPGEPMMVHIPVIPPAAASTFAVEEKLPVGWSVAQVSDDGIYDAKMGCIRWGPFLDNHSRTLSYQITPPRNVTTLGEFKGQVSFDGRVRTIGGTGKVASTDASTGVRLSHLERRHNGGVLVKLTGHADKPCVLEVSTDLIHWTALDPLFLSGDEVSYEDPSTTASDGQRYYRARVQ